MKGTFKQYFELFFCFLRLGCTAFGGPVAHIAFFRDEFVEKQKLLTDGQFTTLVAICQFLPGPASSQLGIALGQKKAGQLGGIIAWFAFTMPSAILLILFAMSLNSLENSALFNIAHGLKLAAIAVIIHALWQMMNNFCKDKTSIFLMLAVTLLMSSFTAIWLQFVAILIAACIGIWVYQHKPAKTESELSLPINQTTANISLVLLATGLFGLPILAYQSELLSLDLFDSFFRIGATVFGGGHVVLPMLKNEIVAAGWVTEQNFLAGYGATQAVPGPIFTFSAFLGAANELSTYPVSTAFICLSAIFLPSFLLVNISLYYWQFVQHNSQFKNALIGINAAVVGLLLSYLVNPVAIDLWAKPQDLALVSVLTLLVFSKKIPIWMIVILTGIISAFAF